MEGTLPAGWGQAAIAELSLPTSTTNPQAYGGGVFTYIDVEAVDNLRQRIERPRKLQNEAAPSRARYAVMPGDVIFSLVRPYLKNIAVVPVELDNAVASTAFFVCRPGTGVDSRYLLNFFRQDSFISSVATYGNSPPSAHDGEFTRLVVPVPPAKEQERIADALDELLSDLDAGVAALERVRDKLKLYRAAVLKAAVEGALTAEWRKQHPRTEPASELLKRILVERRRHWEADQLRKFKEKSRLPPKNWKAKYKDPVEPETTCLPSLPEGWRWASVEQVSSKVVDGVHRKPNYVPAGVPFVTVRNLTAGRGINLERLNYVTPEDHVRFTQRADPQRGDILISKDGTLGVVRVIETNVEFSIFVSVALVKPVILDLSDFLGTALSSPQVQAQMVPKGSGLVHIHLEDLRGDCVPLAPLTEQHEIVEVVEDQLSAIDRLESDIAVNLSSAQVLRQSILRDAFSGKLAPQDPNDEPASELLKRIAAERERRVREAAAAKRLNVRKSPRAAKYRQQAAGAATNESPHGRIADR